MTTFTDRAYEYVQETWQASFTHPFVRGLVDGSLDQETFKFYVIQDAYYLEGFAAAHSLAAYHTEDKQLALAFSEGVVSTIQDELSLHDSFITDLNITDENLANYIPSPNAYAYMNHLKIQAQTGDPAKTVACLLPCYWLYEQIGQHLLEEGTDNKLYARWIKTYADPGFSAVVEKFKSIMNDLAEGKTEAEIQELLHIFAQSTYYEFLFWDDAYTHNNWTVD